MIKIYKSFITVVAGLRDVPLLFLRLILAYGFYGPAMRKIKDFESVANWFDSMNFPVPLLSAYLAGITEFLAVWLFLLGLGTRIISIPVMITMIVAIGVHWGGGFDVANGGFEIPLYYFLMTFALFVLGPGKISLDHLIGRKMLK